MFGWMDPWKEKRINIWMVDAHHRVDPGDNVKVVHEVAHVLCQVLCHLLVNARAARRVRRVCLCQACLQIS